MTPSQAAILWGYAALIAIWPIRWAVLEFVLRRQDMLTPQSPRYQQADPPLVSVILPAKDEEANLPDCLSSLSRQSYPNLEIVVVDDRSTDRTGEIAREMAARDPRIRVLTIDFLPPDWIGKTHALAQAVPHARGEWLLFVDADTLHSPESLAVLMEYGRAHDAALVSLLPELRCETFWEDVFQPMGGITLMQSFPLTSVHNQRSRVAFANGQYILIKQSAYTEAGGHRAVRDRFVEDIALAARIKELGLRVRVALVRGLVSCRMYSSGAQLVRGWSRIFFDGLGRNPWRLARKLLDPVIFCQSGQVALIAGLLMLAMGYLGPFTFALIGMSLIHHFLMFLVFRRVYKLSVPRSRAAIWYPLANLVVDLVLLRAIRMCLTGTISWRGTSYAVSRDSARTLDRGGGGTVKQSASE